MNSHVIYGLFEPDTNYLRYVGCTSRPARRLTEHLKPSRFKVNPELYSWVQKLRSAGSRPVFKILEECSAENKHEAEMFYISYLRSLGCKLANKNHGGLGQQGFKQPPCASEKMSAAKKGKPSWNKGLKSSIETRAKISSALRRRPPASAETRLKVSLAHKGRKHSDEFKEKIRASWIIRKAKKNVR